MGQDVKHPLRGAGLSSLCLQEKKGLLSTRSQWACVRVRVQHSFTGDIGPPRRAGQCSQRGSGSHLGPV